MIKTLVSGIRKILDAPLGRCNWYKKVMLWPFLLVIGLPLYFVAFCVAVLPLLAAGALLFLQSFLYLQDGHWYSLSLLDVATRTVDPKLAKELGEPMLSSCQESRHLLAPGGLDERTHPQNSCPDLNAWQRWLVHPRSWFGLHQILLPLMNLISVPLVLFVVGLFTWQFFLRLKKILHPEAGEPLQPHLAQSQHH